MSTSTILVFGDVQDLMIMRSDTSEGWIKNLLEWNNGQHVANWYISEEGDRLEGAGWDTPVRWGKPISPYEIENTRYILYLGSPFEFDEKAQRTAREIVDRHTELFGATRVGVHMDLDAASIRGRESAMADWIRSGCKVEEKKDQEQ